MKAVLLDGYGGTDVLKVGEAPTPKPAENQVLIRVRATSINRPDLVQRMGNYPPPPGDSEILGLEVAGTVAEVGPGVSEWQVGDRVMSLVGGGGYAEYATAWAGHLMRIPDNLDYEQAACICESYITAYLNIFDVGGLQDGRRVLIHGGAGGVGTAGIQMVQALRPDAHIITTASTPKVDRLREMGAHHVIDYRETPDFAEEIKSITAKKGCDVILDHVGGKYLGMNIKSLAYAGRLVVIGVIGGIKGELNLALMMVKRQQIIGSVLRSRPVEEKARITAAFAREVLPHFANGTIAPLVHEVYDMQDVVKAQDAMEQSSHFGKIVLRISAD